jgi:hypothetical protein
LVIMSRTHEGNDGSFRKDRGVTKERRGFDALASGMRGLKLSDQVQLVADSRVVTGGRRPQ